MADDALIQQYRVASDDMRFLSDQRFKIMTVYLVVNAFLFNAAVPRMSILLGALGMALMVACLAWDARTIQWWRTLKSSAESIETELNKSREKSVEVYLKYDIQPDPKVHRYFGWQPQYPKASTSFFLVYNILGACGLYF